MAKTKRNPQGFERGVAADLWRHTLSQIPYVAGRLAYLASLRNANTGRYEHYGLSELYGAESAHKTLLASHEAAFGEWLNYDLPHQASDLRLYLSELGEDVAAVLTAWRQLGTHRNLIPLTATDAQRELYVLDMEAILDNMRSQLP
jgi:hypothetical protein